LVLDLDDTGHRRAHQNHRHRDNAVAAPGDKSEADGLCQGTQDHPQRHKLPADRRRFCIDDKDVLDLAQCAIVVENHYSKKAGSPTPMDVEWAKDGSDGALYIIQARLVTVYIAPQA
jgi:phosphoenolpyruvate synthase/pyruvate phosphate dikinase